MASCLEIVRCSSSQLTVSGGYGVGKDSIFFTELASENLTMLQSVCVGGRERLL